MELPPPASLRERGKFSTLFANFAVISRRSYDQANMGALLLLRPVTRIFSSAVPRLCDTIGSYMYLFERLTPVLTGRFYRFEHIVSYSSGKVVGKVSVNS